MRLHFQKKRKEKGSYTQPVYLCVIKADNEMTALWLQSRGI